jgi:hypothetical protein
MFKNSKTAVMPQPRKIQISLIDTPFCHSVSRCVRRSFLCGEDEFTGQSYEHRRDWFEERLLLLSSVFSIDSAATVSVPARS